MNNRKFKREYGVSIQMFDLLKSYLSSSLDLDHNTGKHSVLNIDSRLKMFLLFIRRYDTYESLGLKFDICTSYCYRIVNEVKSCLEKLSLNQLESEIYPNDDLLIVDATHVKIEKNIKSMCYTGFKNDCTVKFQIGISSKSKILTVDSCEGSIHDFELFKHSSLLQYVRNESLIIADKGYTGMSKYHDNCLIPIKKNEKSRNFNSSLYNIRIKVEHVFSRLKVFKTLSSVFRSYKHCVESLYSFFIVICAIHNLELSLN